MIRADGWAVNLVGVLGGDKLSVQSRPSEKPWELGVWGPLDEFLILNARRPVDFYIPGEGKPRNLLGCTAWERGESGDRGECYLLPLFFGAEGRAALVIQYLLES